MCGRPDSHRHVCSRQLPSHCHPISTPCATSTAFSATSPPTATAPKSFGPSACVSCSCRMPRTCLAQTLAAWAATCFYHLGRTHDPTFINGPLSASSTRIPIVCSSVQEAELAGTFGAAKIATVERQTLADLGYPQPPTIIHCDNEVAVGIAINRTVKHKLSKSCDMRLHWLQDRVAPPAAIPRPAHSGTAEHCRLLH
jgi:hypothetical protein